MSPTTLSGRLFQTRTAVWIKVRPAEMVQETGIVRAWQGMDKLERVALLTKMDLVVMHLGLVGTSWCPFCIGLLQQPLDVFDGET